ncbi:large ATP-binding protein [Streptacidiphilus sp. P02-A3a]|uniref:large ATP-binding protein n=1 Tax=Streptacidiphilus sp. P02-A3a TaxID=2704468 RepID=UPI0015FBF82E|nr:large ATP-binding protein [Streptacidiphilus sp. P02-A3a]QMU67308.1 large ATP-binding protein [Streptacidiphilus sp. P02-A3a]
MNPHDAAKQPGAHLVAEEFGVEDPWALSDNHPLRDPLDLVGRIVAEAARDVDELHGQLTRAAQSAIELLAPIAQGAHSDMRGWDGILRTTGPQIELLVARRGAAYEQLDRAIAAYRRLLPEADAAQPSKAAAQSLGEEKAPGRSDDWAISGDRQVRALEAVEAGGLRFHQSAVYGYIYLSDGRGQRPTVWPETVRRLVTDGLLDQDPSESLYRPGQFLSLTEKGEAALREARPASPRVSAALSRSSNAAAISNDAADPAVAPLAGATTAPTRSR